jgi:hypothetical protein
MDIKSVKIYKAGNNLTVDLTMGQITRIWLPPSTFDHALINIFIDLPGREGLTALPRMNAEMPGGAAWDYFISTAGFGNAIFSSEGASANNPGKMSGPAAMVSSNQETGTITFQISAEAMGYPSQMSNSKIYITTWDGGPGYPKPFSPEPHDWTFSGGTNDQPRIMDDTELIILD